MNVAHVIWIWMENRSLGEIVGAADARYITSLAEACGFAARYEAVAHPSLPNYIAATSGTTGGIRSDGLPAQFPQLGPSLFEQAPSSGSFEEGMPSNCDLHDDALYVVRHNPEAFYTRIRASCARDDVPLGTPRSGRFLTELEAGSLPAFSFVTPNVCDDMHSCAVSRGDSWLARWVQIIAASRSYREGQVVLFLTWDENDGSTGNHVPLIVVSPFTTPGTRSNGSFTHYSLLRTTEQLLGLHHYLGHAASASSMRVAFGL